MFVVFPYFTVDVRDAGEGNLEMSIMSAAGRNIQNHVKQLSQGRFQVAYTPMEGGQHTAKVTFNDERVPGTHSCQLAKVAKQLFLNQLSEIIHT